MLIEYQNTIDDFREGSTAISRVERKRTPMTRVMGTVVWLVVWLVLRQIISHFTPQEAGAAWIHLMIPIVSVILFWNATHLGAWVRGDVKFRITRSLVLWPAIAGLAALDLWLSSWFTDRIRIIESWPWSWRLLIPHTTWLLLLAGILLTMFKSNVRAMTRNWDAQPFLRRHRTADISATGVIITDSDSRLDYQWTAFTRLQETHDLFILVIGGGNYLMLPKRAFASEEMQDAFRAMARAIAGNVQFGFPMNVQPVSIMPVAVAN